MESLRVNLLVQDALHVCSKRQSLLAEFALQVDKTQGTAWEGKDVIPPILYGTWISFLQQHFPLIQASGLLYHQCPGTVGLSQAGLSPAKRSRKGKRENNFSSTLPSRKQVNSQTPFETWLLFQPQHCSPAGWPERVCTMGLVRGQPPLALQHYHHSAVSPSFLTDVCLTYSWRLLVIEMPRFL